MVTWHGVCLWLVATTTGSMKMNQRDFPPHANNVFANALAAALGKPLPVAEQHTRHLTHNADTLDFVSRIRGGTIIVVDNSNIFLSGRNCTFRIDHEAVLDHLGGDHLISATIVVSQSPRVRSCQCAFYTRLARCGWVVHGFGLIRDRDGRLGEYEDRVDGDVRKLIYAAANTHACQSIVVMSGDGGMTNAAKYARHVGKDVFVIAWDGTLHPALAAAATATATVEDLRPLIGRVLH